ncbi:hypothetical protein C8Q76DRAFT_569609, partial [Earliella scabrosa]
MMLFDAEHLEDGDIPHRTKLRELIRDNFKATQTKLREELQKTLGRISFTADMWTDPILRAFMAITVHYLMRDESHRLVLKCRLL